MQASDRFYAALLTQVINWDDSKDVTEQEHLPVATLGGKFTNSQIGWSTIEKESFPIIKAVQDWEYNLLAPQGFKLYSDHANIISLFRPDKITPTLGRSAIDKVYRWLHTLSYFHITEMTYLKGQKNIWADMLSRWAHKDYHKEEEKKQNNPFRASKISFKRRNALKNPKYIDIMKNQYHPDFELPSKKVIFDSQQLHMDEFEETFMYDTDTIDARISTDKEGIIYVSNKLWIPTS